MAWAGFWTPGYATQQAATPAGPTANEVAAAVIAALSSDLGRLTDLARVHGLVAGEPLVVTPTSRTAGALAQTVSEAAGTVTVTRA